VNRTLAEAFRAAGCGVAYALRTQRNLRIQCAVAAGVLALALVVDASATEVALLAVACGLVLGLELVNTAVEVLVDGLWPQPSEAARRGEDTSAAAGVLGAAAGAAGGGGGVGPARLGRGGGAAAGGEGRRGAGGGVGAVGEGRGVERGSTGVAGVGEGRWPRLSAGGGGGTETGAAGGGGGAGAGGGGGAVVLGPPLLARLGVPATWVKPTVAAVGALAAAAAAAWRTLRRPSGPVERPSGPVLK